MKIVRAITQRLLLVSLIMAMTLMPLVFAGTAGAVTTITITPTSLAAATGDTSYSQTLKASGGTSPYTFNYTGSLPGGMSLASSGKLSGTPTAPAGAFPFTVTATDANEVTGFVYYSLVVNAPSFLIVPTTLTANQYISYTGAAFTTSGGKSPYTFSITPGSLPAGMSLASNGKLSGTPTQAGTFPFTVTATDTNKFTGSANCTLTVVAAPVITISPTTLPAAVVNQSYSTALTASGGTSPYTFSMSGSVPGLVLSTSGALSGTPTQAGTFTPTVTATDKNGDPGSINCTLSVTAPITVSITDKTMYVTVTGMAHRTSYKVSYSVPGFAYDDVETSDGSGYLSSECSLSDAQPGTWTINVYNDTTGVLVATTTYDVPPSSIPEFPTPLAVLLVIGSCAAVYVWMRKRYQETTV